MIVLPKISLFISIYLFDVEELVLTVYLTMDDYGTVYANETQSFDDVNSGIWYNPTIGSLTGARLIAVHIVNTLLVGGFIMSTVYGGCLTNSVNWKCTTAYDSNW